jgi:uncharacterized protein YodC (DUF2158 family)
MSTFTKRTSIATSLMLGIMAGSLFSIPAFSDPVQPDTAMQSQTAISFRRGDLVRLRSGGPLMTIDSIKGDQVDCIWTGLDGEPNAQSFPADVLQRF